jgi:hypothetical protein
LIINILLTLNEYFILKATLTYIYHEENNLFVLVLLLLNLSAFVQDSISEEKEAVKAVIVTLFDAMKQVIAHF